MQGGQTCPERTGGLMASGSDDASTARRVFREILSDPTAGRDHVAGLVDLFDTDDLSTRLNAAWSLCLVATHCPDAVEPITRHLVSEYPPDVDDASPFEADLTLTYLKYRFGDTVTQTISDVTKESAVDEFRGDDQSGGHARSNYIAGNLVSRDVGRTTVPESDASDPRNVYQNRNTEGEEPEEMKDLSELLEGRTDDGDDQQRSAEDRRQRESELELAASEAGIEDVTEESKYDEITILDTGIEGRYTTIYRTRARQGNREEGIAISMFRLPESDTEQFTADVGSALENWAAIADEDSVVSIHDWSVSPTPWVATDFTLQTLYDRIDLSLTEAKQDALTVAKAISYAHQRGVVHAGLDPYNVVYADGFMTNRDQPLVKNFSLLYALRQYFEPSTLLDPRYAAPEYYDRSYGDIDTATDIYQLGAVIYKLLTGRPPFEGPYDEVRSGVLNSHPVPPSERNPEIPEAMDEIVRKAMAKQKLTRYETTTQLVSDLRRVTGE